jgi:hypothetical protein
MRDYVQNRQGFGPIGAAFNVRNRLTGGFDSGLLRPFIESDPNSPDLGRPCAEILVDPVYNNKEGRWEPRRKKYRIDKLNEMGIYSPVFNATTLTRDDWIQIDRAVVKATRLPLSAWDDLRAANTRGGFDAWAKLTLEYSASSDAGEVVKSMDATDPARDDTVLSIMRSVPLPVIHGDFSFPQRFMDVQAQSGMAIDTAMIEQVTRRGWEMVEKTLIGTETGVTWGTRSTGPWPHTGTSTEYGYTNFPYRITKTDLTTPTGSNPEAIVTDVQEMIETMNTNGYFGPFVLYHSTPYSLYLNADYFRSGSTSAVRTVRERLMELDGISSIRRVNYLTSGYQLVLVDLMSGKFSAINGMMPRVVQWDERGGLTRKFAVLMIQCAFLQAEYDGKTPLLHATTS